MAGHKSPKYSDQQIEKIKLEDNKLYNKSDHKKVKKFICPNCGMFLELKDVVNIITDKVIYKPYCIKCRLPLVLGKFY